MRLLFLSVFFFLLVGNLSLNADESQERKDVLDKLGEAISWQRNCVFNTEMSSYKLLENGQYEQGATRRSKINFNYDTNQYHMLINYGTSDAPGRQTVQTLLGMENFTDDSFVCMAGPPYSRISKYNDKGGTVQNYRSTLDVGAPLYMMYNQISVDKNFYELLCESNPIIESDIVSDKSLLKLSANSTMGNINLWISPDESFVPVKCEIIKEVERHMNPDGKGVYSLEPIKENGAVKHTLRNIYTFEFSQYMDIDGFYIPTFVDFERIAERDDGSIGHYKAEIKASNFIINPDMQQRPPFELVDVTEGAIVECVDFEVGGTTKGVWQNGEIQSYVAASAVADIKEIAQSARGDAEQDVSLASEIQIKRGHNNSALGTAQRSSKWVMRISIMLLVGFLIPLVVFYVYRKVHTKM